RGSAELTVEASRRSPLPTTPLTLHFEVKDTGSGISPDELDKVFEPFVQTQSGRTSQKGTGLGLPISRKFVQLMGGDMRLSSRLVPFAKRGDAPSVQGTIVTFNIQAEEAEVTTVDEAQHRHILGLAAGQPNYRILVVDDKPDNRKLLIKLLNPLGFELREAVNGQKAVEIWKDWQPHLIWMDLRMPVMEGYEATRRIRAGGARRASPSPTTKIIALSASSFKEEQTAALAAGCDAFLRKPFQEAEIFETMGQQLGIRYIYDDEIHNDAPVQMSGDEGTLLEGMALSGVSPQLLADLEAATLRLHWDQILQLIEEIRIQDRGLADRLISTVHNFQYTQILESIQAVKEPQ
ncbi:MAG: response regulator, partial [Cyanobacteria bacterium P01_F01_bin.4]